MTGDDTLGFWKLKVPLERVVEGQCDGRSIQGLKRAAQRLAANSKKKAESHILGNYVKVIQVGQMLAPSNFNSVGDDELKMVIQVMGMEGLQWPESTKFQLIMRRAAACLAERRIEEVWQVVDPWGEQKPWNPSMPCLQALDDRSKALSTWRRILFSELLGDLLVGGEDRSPQVVALSKLSLSKLEMIDFMDLDATAASYLDESITVFRALIALAEPSLDMKHEACS